MLSNVLIKLKFLNINRKLIWLMLIFFVMNAKVVIAKGVTENIDLPSVCISQNVTYDMQTEGKPFFLFSNIELEKGHIGDVFLFFSDIKIADNFDGNAYLFFSTVEVMNSASLNKNVYLFSSSAMIYNKLENQKIQSIFGNQDIFIQKSDNNTYFMISNVYPRVILLIVHTIIKIFVLMIIFSMKKSFFEQGYGACVHEKTNIIRNGLLLSFLFLCIIVVFFLSIVGFPIAILILLFYIFICLLGQTSLSMYIGELFAKKIKFNSTNFPYSNIILGGIIIETMNFIPYIYYIFSYFLIPVICCGIVYVSILNGFVLKKFYC